MSHTAARVTSGGLGHRIVGALKETITDITVSDNSEVVTAATLGLNTIFKAESELVTGQATDDAVYFSATIASSGASITVAGFTAAGVAATVAADTVVRVTAQGY